MNRFEKENQDLFIVLASILNTKGADIEMESNWDSANKTIEYTNVPVIRGYRGSEGEGFYFRARNNHFGLGAQELIASFPINIDGYKFKAVSFSGVEYDDDRIWPESIAFIITKNEKNVLK